MVDDLGNRDEHATLIAERPIGIAAEGQPVKLETTTNQERSDASDRLVGLLFDGLRHGAVAGSTLKA